MKLSITDATGCKIIIEWVMILVQANNHGPFIVTQRQGNKICLKFINQLQVELQLNVVSDEWRIDRCICEE